MTKRLIGGAAVLLVLVTLTVTACGGSSSGSAAAAQSRPALGPGGNGAMPGFDSAAFQKFSSCLKSHGVALPNGPPVQGQGPNPNSSKFREAMNACKQYAPQMPQGQGPPGNQGPPSNSGSGGFPNST